MTGGGSLPDAAGFTRARMITLETRLDVETARVELASKINPTPVHMPQSRVRFCPSFVPSENHLRGPQIPMNLRPEPILEPHLITTEVKHTAWKTYREDEGRRYRNTARSGKTSRVRDNLLPALLHV